MDLHEHMLCISNNVNKDDDLNLFEDYKNSDSPNNVGNLPVSEPAYLLYVLCLRCLTVGRPLHHATELLEMLEGERGKPVGGKGLLLGYR